MWFNIFKNKTKKLIQIKNIDIFFLEIITNTFTHINKHLQTKKLQVKIREGNISEHNNK